MIKESYYYYYYYTHRRMQCGGLCRILYKTTALSACPKLRHVHDLGRSYLGAGIVELYPRVSECVDFYSA